MKAAYTRLLVWPRSVRKSEYLTASESCGLNSAVEINYERLKRLKTVLRIRILIQFRSESQLSFCNFLTKWVILISFTLKNCRIGFFISNILIPTVLQTIFWNYFVTFLTGLVSSRIRTTNGSTIPIKGTIPRKRKNVKCILLNFHFPNEASSRIWSPPLASLPNQICSPIMPARAVLYSYSWASFWKQVTPIALNLAFLIYRTTNFEFFQTTFPNN